MKSGWRGEEVFPVRVAEELLVYGDQPFAQALHPEELACRSPNSDSAGRQQRGRWDASEPQRVRVIGPHVQLESGSRAGPGFAQEYRLSGKVDDERAIGISQPEPGHQPGSCSNVGKRLVGDNVFEQSPEMTVDLVGIAKYGHN